MKFVFTGEHLITIVLLIGAFGCRFAGVNGLMETIICVIAASHLGLDVYAIVRKR